MFLNSCLSVYLYGIKLWNNLLTFCFETASIPRFIFVEISSVFLISIVSLYNIIVYDCAKPVRRAKTQQS